MLPPRPAPRADHVAVFHHTDRFLVNRVASFIGEVLTAGEHVVVLATLAHWNAISARLEETGIDYGRAAVERRLVLLDAEDILDGITADGRVSTEAFRRAVGRVLRNGSSQRLCGELLSLLAQAGNLDAALAIESVAHELAQTLDIPVLCGYPVGSYSPFSAADIARIEVIHDRSVIEVPAGSYVDGRESIVPDSAARRHAVQFYDSPESLAKIVGRFIGEGFVAGLPAIVIATPDHRAAIAEALAARYFDVGRLAAEISSWSMQPRPWPPLCKMACLSRSGSGTPSFRLSSRRDAVGAIA